MMNFLKPRINSPLLNAYSFGKFDSNIRNYSLHKTVTGFVCQKQWIISTNHSFMYWQMLKGAGRGGGGGGGGGSGFTDRDSIVHFVL